MLLLHVQVPSLESFVCILNLAFPHEKRFFYIFGDTQQNLFRFGRKLKFQQKQKLIFLLSELGFALRFLKFIFNKLHLFDWNE